MKILFSGDRNWANHDVVEWVMMKLYEEYSPYEVIHGWAKGLDTMVDEVALALGFSIHREPSHWRHNEPKWVWIYGHCSPDCKEMVGRPAGMIRNHKMFDKWNPQLVIGFHDNIAQSKGTKGMLDYATKKKCPTFLVTSTTYKLLPTWLDKLKQDDVLLFFNF